MSNLSIRKKSLNTWLHTDSVFGDFIISKFYFNSFEAKFQIVEEGNTRLEQYLIANITLYDDTDGGTPETFSTITELSLRLEELQYPAFDRSGGTVSISGLIEAGTNVTITGSGTTSDPYVINSSGGGGSTPNFQEVTDVAPVGETTNPIKVVLDANNYVIINNNVIQHYESGALRSSWDYLNFNMSDADGNIVNISPISGIEFTIGGDTLKLTPSGIEWLGIVYPFPTGVSSSLATLDDLNNSNSYSTTEKLTGGTWIDDKPIYRKVIEYTFDSSGLGVSIAHGISDLENIVDGKIIIQGSSRRTDSISTSNNWGDTYVTDTNVEIENILNQTDITINIILEYTKTTD